MTPGTSRQQRRQHRFRPWLASHVQSAFASLGVLCRTPWSTSLTVAVIGIALALPMAAFLVVQGLGKVAEEVDLNAEISLFLLPELSNEQAQTLAAQLTARADILTARVITKEQGLREFRNAAGVAGVLDTLSDSNPLPAVVMAAPAESDPSVLSQLSASLAKLQGVEFVQLDQDWVVRLQAILELARRLLWIAALLFGTGVMLIVGNTLRLSIESRRAEIEIAKLFGASDAFVRRPFLYHGLYFGLAGALLAGLLVVGAGVALAEPLLNLGALYQGEPLFSLPSLEQAILLLLIGTGLGLLGAWLSVTHHLRAIQPR